MRHLALTVGAPAGRWGAVALDVALVAGLAAAGWLYLRGVRAVAAHGRALGRGRAAAFAAGLAAVAAALLSPMEAAAQTLLSAHMVQHLLLTAVAAPLLVAGAPLVAVMTGLPVRWRRRVRRIGRAAAVRWTGRALTTPAVAWTLAAVTLWVWHAPAPYQAAVRNEAVHVLQHASFLGTAVLFWWVGLGTAGRRRLPRGADVVYVVTGGLQGAALGAVLTFASAPLYPIYAGAAPWGATALQDQQLAGLIMWIPAGLIYLGVAAGLFVRWLHAAEQAARREEAAGRRAGAPPVRHGGARGAAPAAASPDG